MSAEDDGAQLEFAWDPAKATSNVAKHGVAFAQAASVFADALALTVFDEATQVRIISAREATRAERRQYEDGPQ